MGGFKGCVIKLDNPWNTYYGGQTINGRTDVILGSPKKIRGVYVIIKGHSETSWTESKSRRDRDGKTHHYTEYYTGNEEYFNFTYYLIGSRDGSEIELPAGTHSFNFTCTLPPGLPSSFEGEHGYIRYTIKVTVDRPWRFDHETKMAFTVIAPLDLNMNPKCREPIMIQMEDTFCCFCCKSGPFSVDVRAPVTGYCSGQVIPLHIEYENHSDVEVEKIKCKLIKKVVFRTTSPHMDSRDTSETIAEAVEMIGSKKSGEADLAIEIPPLPPSNLVNCGLIDLDYELYVEAHVSGMHCNLSSTRTIIIGSVPLVGYQPMPPSQGTQPIQSGYQSPAGYPQHPQTGYPYPPGGQPAETTQSGYPYPPQGYPSQATHGYPPQPPQGFPPQSAPYPPSDAPLLPNSKEENDKIGWNFGPGAPPLPATQGSQSPPVAPIFKMSPFANSIKDSSDNDHTHIAGNGEFSPYYPTFAFNPDVIPPSQQPALMTGEK